MRRKMNSHCVERVFVKILKLEVGYLKEHVLSIHKTNFENWELELRADEEQLHYFEEVNQKKEPIEFAIYIQYMNRLTGKAIVKSIKENTIVAKGITVLSLL